MLLAASAEHAPNGKRRKRGKISDLARATGKADAIEIEGDWTGGSP